MNEQSQLELLQVFRSRFKTEYDQLPRERTSTPHQYFVNNGTFGSVDGEILYCMVRHLKPAKFIEVGSGNSTFLSAQAVLKNKEEDSGHDCELTAIEPYPSDALKNGFDGLSRLVTKEVQQVPISEFHQLDGNDILFIDSSHVLKIGSDVQHLYLRVLPELRKGTVVHIHDIFLPAEYPRRWIMDGKLFWNEQYLLQAFLMFNDSFEILWAGSYMHLKHPDELGRSFSSYDRNTCWPGSFWMRKTK